MIRLNDIACLSSLYQGCEKWIRNPEVSSDWFDPSQYLGKKGHRYFNDPTKYLLSAATMLELEEDSELVFSIGSGTADAIVRKAVMESLLKLDDAELGAAYAPNTSINMPASNLSIKYRSCNPNYTFSGRDAGLVALWHGLRQLEEQNTGHGIFGVTEQYSQENKISGSILWEVNNKNKEAICEMESFQFLSLDMFKMIFGEFNFQDDVIIISRCNKYLKEVRDTFESNKLGVEHINCFFGNEFDNSDFDIFLMLGLLIKNDQLGSIIVVSDSGYVFCLNVAKGKLK